MRDILNKYLSSNDLTEKQAVRLIIYFFGWAVILSAIYFISLKNYLLFHILAELFSIIIAYTLFTIAWNSRKITTNNFLLIIGISSLFAASIDFVHILTYKGMAIFPGLSANIATQLWLAARYLQCLSILAAAFWLYRGKRKPGEAVIIFFFYLALTAVLMLSVLYWQNFPTAFVEGSGLTPFKKISEYIISAILLISLLPLYKKRQEFSQSVFGLIVSAIVVMICSELSFTLYLDPYGLFNKIGHFLKIISYYLLYRAVIVANFKDPFETMFKKLKEVDKAKSEFISLVAHQLRTPLSTISLTAEMLTRGLAGEINDKTKLYLENIATSVKGMSELIDTFLNISKIEMGTFPINPAPADLIKTVDGILTDLEPQISNKHLNFKKNYFTEQLAINLDQKAMRVILENLIANAIKYTDQGGAIAVDIFKQNQEIIIKVADNGWGIPKEQQVKIFEKRYRADNVKKTSAEGLGLGLYTVKLVIERTNGRIWFESEENQGTTFYVAFPAEGMRRKEKLKNK